MSHTKDGITYNDLDQPLPWESGVKQTESPFNLPWFKDLTQVKRFVNGRAYRGFEKNETPEEKAEFEKIKSIFGS